LGSGCTADVHLAEDLNTDGMVVVKRMNAQAAKVQELLERFPREAMITQAVNHPSVARVLDVARPGHERPYFVMEALHGETLGEYLRRETRMPIELAFSVLRQAAAGLASVHRAGVVHSDVKPDNLFLVGAPGAPQGVKLLDFGMAKLLSESPHGPSDVVAGTALYMAPEQILGEAVDSRTDVYALAVVAFRMWTGHLPFDAEAPRMLLSHQLFSPAPPLSWLVEGIDPRLEAVVLRALSKHPDNRHRSMAALINDLDTCAGVLPMETRLFADAPREQVPDAYVPETVRGRCAARALARGYSIAVPALAEVDGASFG
jgi:serine/threonine-protein kinase